MEVKIGVRNSGRELVLVSSQTSDAVSKVVAAAVSDSDGVLELVDEKGRKVIVPVAALGYVEIGASEVRKVGFSTS